MLESARTVYAMNLGLLKSLVKDLTPEQMVEQLTETTNPPVWILGHLAVTSDGIGELLGLPKALPAAWHEQFKPGSKPMPSLKPMPTKDELVSAIEKAHERLSRATETVDPARLTQPHGISFLENTPAKTIADALTVIMTLHDAFHVGQLSYCRRQMGYSPLF
jgi:hypothetical protein